MNFRKIFNYRLTVTGTFLVSTSKYAHSELNINQCSGSGSVGTVIVWASRIPICYGNNGSDPILQFFFLEKFSINIEFRFWIFWHLDRHWRKKYIPRIRNSVVRVCGSWSEPKRSGSLQNTEMTGINYKKIQTCVRGSNWFSRPGNGDSSPTYKIK